MALQIGIDEIDILWARFSSKSPGNRDVVTVENLLGALEALGEDPSAELLKSIADDVDARDGLSHHQFRATIASLRGDPTSRLKIAFDLFDENGDGEIVPDELRDVLLAFGLSETQVSEFFAAADSDGSGAIDFEEFCAFAPEVHEQHAQGYRDAHVLPPAPAPIEIVPVASAETAGRATPDSGHRRRGEGTSRLQMQIGLFRLLQGAAYRSFRESFAANYETHLCAKTMPYTITNFADFSETAIALYKALGIVEQECFPVLDAVSDSLRQELERLDERIANWPSVDKTPGMLAAARAMEAERSNAATSRHVFGAAVECALTLRRKGLELADLASGHLDLHELRRLQSLDLHEEALAASTDLSDNPPDYLHAWNRVILDDADEEIDGAMMPSAYWYEDFMPKLLAACSVGTAEDVASSTVPDEAALDQWFAATKASGEFDPFGGLDPARFEKCSPSRKLAIRQAWRLTRHYLNGVQKRRERLEFGRDTGFLPQYVAFLDVYLGRNDVREASMRVSFPYFIGPATWRFLHTTAEIVCSRDTADQGPLIALFKDFFRALATMYPCPYCRFHLNRYVVRNREIELYPLEYLVLGCDPNEGGFDVSIDDKLETITDGVSMRLFLWKLHNAVSSSITRSEPWFHRDDHAFYASRYWPSLGEELACARAFRQEDLPVERLSHFSSILSHVGRLASLRGHWQGVHVAGGTDDVGFLLEEMRGPVRELEDALATGAFLERTYRFDASFEDEAPHFTPEEEAFGRSGMFVEA